MHPCRPSSEGRYHEPDNYPSVNKRSTAVIQPGAASSCVCLQRWEEQTKGTPALIARQDEIPETLTFLVLILVLVEVALRVYRFCAVHLVRHFNGLLTSANIGLLGELYVRFAWIVRIFGDNFAVRYKGGGGGIGDILGPTFGQMGNMQWGYV